MNKIDSAPIPMSIESEQAVIGGVLTNPDLMLSVAEILRPEDFYSSDNRILYSAIVELDDKRQVDFLAVAELAEAKTGKKYLPLVVELVQNCAGTSNIEAHAKTVRDLAVKRSLLTFSKSVESFVNSAKTASASDAINFASQELTKIDNSQLKDNSVMEASQAMKLFVQELDQRFQRGDALNGFSSGWNSIDYYTRGWKRKNLVIIAGRPSMGKTTYALNMAANMARNGAYGLFFSVEMSSNELMEKLTACVGKIPLDFLQNPSKWTTDTMWPKVETAARAIKELKFKIIECPGIHFNQIKSYARKAARNGPLDFIVVDHIHIVRGDGKERERELASISWALKTLAGQLDITVFALAQLNRGVESRSDKQPRLSDLRDSGSLEQDADVIQLIYRDDYYNDDDKNPNAGLVQIETAKHRNGKSGKSTLGNSFAESRLTEIEAHIRMQEPQKGYTYDPDRKSRFDDL